MKKIVLTIFIIVITITLASCKDDGNVLKVGMDLRYPPFETRDNNNEAIGISVDVAHAFGEYLEMEVRIVPMDFSNLIIALQNGEIDVVIASMSITEERKKAVDFSQPYFYFKIISLLNKDFADSNNLDEDSTVEELLSVENVNYVGLASQVSASIPEGYGKEVKKATNPATAVEEVAQGTSDVFLMSASPVVGAHRAYRESTIVMWDSFVSSPIGMAFKKGSDLREKANAFIETLNDEGGLYNMLREKWNETILGDLERYGLDFFIEE